MGFGYLRLLCGLVLAFAGGGSSLYGAEPIDAGATPETRALFTNLRAQMGHGVLFGHQHATIEGRGWRDPIDTERSDVKSLIGAFPAVYGWDLIYIFGSPHYPPFTHLREHIRAAYDRGGVNTISWHIDNPVTGKNAWNRTPAVRRILPGGSHHAAYLKKLDEVADFLGSLEGSDGKKIPVIFRPFHENNGPWFWWGKYYCTRQDYIRLWRFTVEYLRDVRGVHNLLYAYSPSRKLIEYIPVVGRVPSYRRSFLDRYPGDAYVDVLGYEEYGGSISNHRLSSVIRLAEERAKIAAITETGVEGVPDPNWWTGTFLKALRGPSGRRAAFALLWRNDWKRRKHHYAPFPGHASADDFVAMSRDGAVVFGDTMPPMYSP